jgi:hypothetical protein
VTTTSGWEVLLKVKRAPDVTPGDGKFREADHPRDRMGRFIETGSEVRLMGGALATVLGPAGNGRISIRRQDGGGDFNVDKGSVTVTKRPDGSAPTSDPNMLNAAKPAVNPLPHGTVPSPANPGDGTPGKGTISTHDAQIGDRLDHQGQIHQVTDVQRTGDVNAPVTTLHTTTDGASRHKITSADTQTVTHVGREAPRVEPDRALPGTPPEKMTDDQLGQAISDAHDAGDLATANRLSAVQDLRRSGGPAAEAPAEAPNLADVSKKLSTDLGNAAKVHDNKVKGGKVDNREDTVGFTLKTKGNTRDARANLIAELTSKGGYTHVSEEGDTVTLRDADGNEYDFQFAHPKDEKVKRGGGKPGGAKKPAAGKPDAAAPDAAAPAAAGAAPDATPADATPADGEESDLGITVTRIPQINDLMRGPQGGASDTHPDAGTPRTPAEQHAADAAAASERAAGDARRGQPGTLGTGAQPEPPPELQDLIDTYVAQGESPSDAEVAARRDLAAAARSASASGGDNVLGEGPNAPRPSRGRDWRSDPNNAVTPQMMQDAQDVIGADRVGEITGGRGLDGANAREAQKIIDEAAQERLRRDRAPGDPGNGTIPGPAGPTPSRADFLARRADLGRQADAAAARGDHGEERRLRDQMVQEVSTYDAMVEADGGNGAERRRADALVQGDVILERDPNSLDPSRVNQYEVSRSWENGAYYRRAQGRAGLGERVEAPADQEFVVRPKPAPGTGSGRRRSVLDLPRQEFVPQGQGPDKGTATNPGRDSRNLTFETPAQLSEFLHKEADLEGGPRAVALRQLADEPSLTVKAPGDVAYIKLPGNAGYQFFHARSGRDLGIPADAAKNKRQADEIASEVGLRSGVDFSHPWEEFQAGMRPKVDGYVNTFREENAPKPPRGRGAPAGPPNPYAGLPAVDPNGDTEASVRARLHAMATALEGSGGVQYTTKANMVRDVANAPDLAISSDGSVAGYSRDGYAVVIATGNGNPVRAPGTDEPSTVQVAVDELAGLGIPFGDDAALRQRWTDKNQRAADQQAATEAWARATAPADGLTPIDVNDPASIENRLDDIATRDEGATDPAGIARLQGINGYFRSQARFGSQDGRYVGYYPSQQGRSGSPVFLDTATGDRVNFALNDGESIENGVDRLAADGPDGAAQRSTPAPAGIDQGAWEHELANARGAQVTQEQIVREEARTGQVIVQGRDGLLHVYDDSAYVKPAEPGMLAWSAPNGEVVGHLGLDGTVTTGPDAVRASEAERARYATWQQRSAVTTTHPVGATVDARQPGVDRVTRGTVSGHTDNGMVQVDYTDRHGATVTGTFNPSHTDVVPGTDQGGQGGNALPAPDPAHPQVWGQDPETGVVSMIDGEGPDQLTAAVIPNGVPDAEGTTWNWTVVGGGDRTTGSALDRDTAMGSASAAMDRLRGYRAEEKARADAKVNAVVPDSFASKDDLGGFLASYLGLPDSEAPRLARVFGDKPNPDFQALAKIQRQVPASALDPVRHTLLATTKAGPDGKLDGARAAAALKRLQADDPSLPMLSVGQHTKIRVLADGPQPLLPNERNPLIFREVSGTVDRVEPMGATGQVSVIIRPDNPARESTPFLSELMPGDSKLPLDAPAGGTAPDVPDLPGPAPTLPDGPPEVSGSKRAADLIPGDRVLVDRELVTITGSRRDDGDLVLTYTGADGVDWEMTADDAESFPAIVGGSDGQMPLDFEPLEGQNTAVDDHPDSVLGGKLVAGDRYRAYNGIHNVIAVHDDGNPDTVTITTEMNGVRDTYPLGREAVLNRVRTEDLPAHDPLPDGTSAARPVLYTYQRKRLVALGLDEHPNADVAQAARRVRARQPLSADQSRALSEHLQAIAANDQIRPQQQRAYARLAAAFDAAGAHARGIDAPAPTFSSRAKPEKGTLRDLTEGDHVAFTNLNGATVGGKLTGIRTKMGGRLYEVTLTGPDGQTETHLLNRDTATYRLPDLPEPVVIGNPPPSRTGPVREHIHSSLVEVGDTITASSGGVATSGRVTRIEDKGGRRVIEFQEPGRNVTSVVDGDPIDGTPTIIRTARGEGSAAQPWSAVLPDENPTPTKASELNVGDRVEVPTPWGVGTVTGTVEDVEVVTSSRGSRDDARILTVRSDQGAVNSHHVMASDTLTRLAAGDENAAQRVAAQRAAAERERRIRLVAHELDMMQQQNVAAMVGRARMGAGSGRYMAAMELDRWYAGQPSDIPVAQSIVASLSDHRLGVSARNENAVPIREMVTEHGNKLRDSLKAAIGDPNNGLDGEREHETVNRILDQFEQNPPGFDAHAVAATLVDSADQLGKRENGEPEGPSVLPTLPEGADIGTRVKAYRAALPEDLSTFDKLATRRTAYGKLDIAALERGEVPPVVMSAGGGNLDRAADGGPGEHAMANLNVVMAAGHDLRQEHARRVEALLAQDPGPKVATEAEMAAINAARADAYGAVSVWEQATKDRIAREHGFATFSSAQLAQWDRENPEAQTRAKAATSDFFALVGRMGAEPGDPEYKRLKDEAQAAAQAAIDARNSQAIAKKHRATMVRQATLDVLSQARPMGGKKITYESYATRAKAPRPLTERNELVKAMRFAESNYPTEWLEKVAAKDGGKAYQLKSIGRGHHEVGAKRIALSKDGAEKVAGSGDRGRVATHELGHGMEQAIPGLSAAERAYLWSRTSTGEVGSRERERVKGIHGSRKELGWQDEFPEHYTGRDYSGRFGGLLGGGRETDSFEVFTTTVESVMAGSEYADEGLTAFLLGTMALL